LEDVAVVCFVASYVEHLLNDFGALRVVAFGPVVSGTALTVDHIVRLKEAAGNPRANRLHHSRLQVDEHSAGDVPTDVGVELENRVAAAELLDAAHLLSVQADPMLAGNLTPVL
jgi:hypothetical protein